MQTINKIIHDIQLLFGFKPTPLDSPKSGPNNMSELLKQFDSVPKQKTQEDVTRDYCIKEAMAQLEIDMLKMEPATMFRAGISWLDENKIKHVDWAHCATRPETIYCCYGKN